MDTSAGTHYLQTALRWLLLLTLTACQYGCDKRNDITGDLADLRNIPLRATLPMFVLRNHTESGFNDTLYTGSTIDNFPKSVEEWRASPQGWPADIVGAVPPMTKFRVMRLWTVEKFANPKDIEIEVLFDEGEYAGRKFTMNGRDILVPAGESNRPGSGPWRLLDFVLRE